MTSKVEKRPDAVTAEDTIREWEKHPEGETPGEDNSHLPPLPLPTVTEPRPIDPETGAVKWTVSELYAQSEEEEGG